MTLVSVCIRTHDRPDTLHEAIASALAQRLTDLEVIVSDDGTASSRHVADGFRDPRVRYQRLAPAGGPAVNLSACFDAARGAYIALLDDDDRWYPEFLARVLAPFHADPELGIVFSNCDLLVGDRRVRRSVCLAPGRHDDLLYELLAQMPIAPSAAVLRRDVLEQGQAAAPLAPDCLGATTVFVRAACAGWPMFYLDAPLVGYRMHAGQITWGPGNTRKEIAALERFRFDEPRCEAARRERLAHAHMSAAGFELRDGRVRAGARGVRTARRVAPGGLRPAHWLSFSGLRAGVMLRLLGRPTLLLRLRTLCLAVARGFGAQSTRG